MRVLVQTTHRSVSVKMASSNSDDKSDLDIPSTSSKKRKYLPYLQNYKEEWENDMKWLSKSKKGPLFAW